LIKELWLSHASLGESIAKLSFFFFQRPYAPSAQYSYNNWSPPAQSNESTNGYFLERSNSARKTLERACELCPEEVC